MIEKKISRYMGITMGITMSCTMSVVGSLMGALNAAKQSGAPFLAAWIPSLLASLVITLIIALGLGFIVPMKKINDSIEQKTKTKGFVLHLLQSLASDLVYTPLISLVMAFFSTAVFIIPKNPALEMNMLVPVALGNFARSFLIEFVIALIVIMIVEPIYQKNAFKKYIPGYGEKVAGDEDI